MRPLVVLCFLCSVSYASHLVASTNYQRVQELFIWKVAEELQLDSEKHDRFGRIIRDVGRKKRQISGKMNKTLGQMRNAEAKKLEVLLKDYESLLHEYSELQQTEFKELRDLLDSKKLAKYFVLKNLITKSLKRRLATSNSKKTKVQGLPQPKLINK